MATPQFVFLEYLEKGSIDVVSSKPLCSLSVANGQIEGGERPNVQREGREIKAQHRGRQIKNLM